EPDVREAPSRIVREQQVAVGGVDEDHADRHVAEDGFEPVLGLPALVGQLAQAPFTLADAALLLDPWRDVVEGVDRHDGSVPESGGSRPEHGPALDAVDQAEPDEDRLRGLAEQDPTTGK